MSAVVSFESMVTQLQALGFSREKAEAKARAEHGLKAPVSTASPPQAAPIAMHWPVRLRLPWSVLVSDNDKYRVVVKYKDAKPYGSLFLTEEYSTAKDRISALARDVMAGRPPAAFPLRLEALVFLPDNRIHDVCNFSKCVHDALKGTVFVDDQWLDDGRWRRGGVDGDAPRAELTISPTLRS